MTPWTHPSPQTKWYLYRFSRFCTMGRPIVKYMDTLWSQSVHILYNGTPLFPLKIAPSHGGSGPPYEYDTWLPGPTPVLNPNSISIGSAILAGLTSVTDRPIDHATWSVTTDRIYVRSTAMRSKNYYCVGLTPFEWLSSTRDFDLDWVIRHTIVYQSSTSTYIPNFIEIGKTFLL